MTHLETIELALEALEDLLDAVPPLWECAERAQDTITALRQVREQIEQAEPVAIVDSTITGHIDWLCTFFPKQGTKLYTSPQPRQPLTLVEIHDLYEEVAKKSDYMGSVTREDVVRAIKAAHGIKE